MDGFLEVILKDQLAQPVLKDLRVQLEHPARDGLLLMAYRLRLLVSE
jgi:hypothetical protein